MSHDAFILIVVDQVNGLVAELVNVPDSQFCTALEVTAGLILRLKSLMVMIVISPLGGKLFNVVVDNENTGKLLLGKGKLKRRVTIIPLNKISHRTVSKDVFAAAEKEVCK
jgi:structural maintenance of chromosome 2